VQCLNNTLEQDHRAFKKRIRATQHFRQFSCARRTIPGYETMHKIRKGLYAGRRRGMSEPRIISSIRHSASPPEPAASVAVRALLVIF
jgi:hypothetical protein